MEKLITTAEAATMLRVTERRLKAAALDGRGPKPVKLGDRVIGFHPEEIKRWFYDRPGLDEDAQ